MPAVKRLHSVVGLSPTREPRREDCSRDAAGPICFLYVRIMCINNIIDLKTPQPPARGRPLIDLMVWPSSCTNYTALDEILP